MKFLLPLLLLVGLAGCADYDDYAYQPPYPAYAYGYGYGNDYAPPYYTYRQSYNEGYSGCGWEWGWNSCDSTFGGGG